MKSTLFTWIALVLGTLPSAFAEEVAVASQAEFSRALEQQNARIAVLENALQDGEYAAYGESCEEGCLDGCCEGDACCDPCCRPAGYIVGAELAFLKPHSSLGTRGAQRDIDFGYDLAPRIWLGYQGSDGLGWRVRYWEFNHRKDVRIDATTADMLSYDTYVLDAEFFDSLNLGCYWDASLSAGFRYVEYGQERVAFNVNTRRAFEGNQFDNSSIGLTLAGELRRCMGCGVAGFLNSRASVLLGDEIETAIDPVGGGWSVVDRELDNLYYIWEAQAGAQWTQELCSGYLFARAACEVQIWDNVAGAGEDWGLGGFLFSAGVIR